MRKWAPPLIGALILYMIYQTPTGMGVMARGFADLLIGVFGAIIDFLAELSDASS